MTATANDTPQTTSTMDERTVRDIVELIDFMGSAKDAMNDQIVMRLARTASEGMALLDRLTRNEGLMRLLQVLDQPEMQYLMTGLAKALTETSREIASEPPAKGGLVELMRLMSTPGTQEGLRALSKIGEHLSESLRELHRQGG